MNNNKIALVTGGSRGLGKDMALRLAEKGIDVILTYHKSADEAEVVVRQIAQSGRKAAALQLDTSSIKSFDQFSTELNELLHDHFGTASLDFLINNAGFGRIAAIRDFTEEIFDELMNVHFKGVFFLTQKIIPVLNAGGGIVNVSSGLARMSVPGSSVYASMKGAIEVFTRYLAKELGPKQIRANVIAPGAVATDFNDAHLRKDERLSTFVSSVTALGRVGMADDIGGVVAFLCTDDAKWVNGQRIEISGGMFV